MAFLLRSIPLGLLAGLCAVATGLSGARAEPASAATDLPLWELGAGAVLRYTSEYPGSDNYDPRVAGFPFLAYRGQFLELGGDQFLRLGAFPLERLEVALSFESASRIDSRDSALRGSLPDLDARAEFGPELIYRAADVAPLLGARAGGRIELALQTRGVFTVSTSPDYEGFIVRPAVRYRQNGALKPGSRVQISLGPVFATEGVHDLLYEVPQGSDLPAYDAGGGYLGLSLDASIRYPLTRRVRIFGGVGGWLLTGAANADSPLVATEATFAAFIGVTVSLFQSRASARRDR